MTTLKDGKFELKKFLKNLCPEECSRCEDGKSRLNSESSNMYIEVFSAKKAEEGKPAKGVQLQRELGLMSAVNLILSVMIGSGIFVSPTRALKEAGSIGMALIVWALCGTISMLGALSYAELGTVVNKSGAEYSYYREAFGPLHKFWGPLPSFINCWVSIVFVRPAEIAIIILTFAEYFTQLLNPIIPPNEIDNYYDRKKIVAIAALLIITAINFFSVKLYVKIQNIFSSFKVAACFLVIGCGLYYIFIGKTQNLENPFKGSDLSPRAFAVAFYHGLWAYDGWSSVTTVTEEIKKPNKNIPRAVIIAVPLVTMLYCFMNVSYMTVLSVPELIQAKAVANEVGVRVLGHFSCLIPMGVALSTFGCALSVQFGVTRLCYSAAKNGHMMEVFSYVHSKRLTPAPAVLLQGALCLVCILAGDIITLIEFASFLVWTFYGLAMVALIVMRYTKKDVPRPWKVPIVIPIFVMIIASCLAIIPIAMKPQPQYLIAVGFLISGFVVYIPFIYFQKKLFGADMFTKAVKSVMNVQPPDQDQELIAKKTAQLNDDQSDPKEALCVVSLLSETKDDSCCDEPCRDDSCHKKSCCDKSCLEKSCCNESCLEKSCCNESCLEKSCCDESCPRQ
ncbi:unnamed protein product [Bemisia tabaci]|uniref:b(0,+)-type amino acid transporter 1 n=1 Tax=Bemisia tabaci TaxID=7038 RepID=A0A9P0CDJ1_BEMTA|nr:unnamed protein product [Bemisia tabaci]